MVNDLVPKNLLKSNTTFDLVKKSMPADERNCVSDFKAVMIVLLITVFGN